MKLKIFPSFCKAAAVLAYVGLAAPFACLYFDVYGTGNSTLKSLLYSLVLVVAGYAVQAFFGFVTRFTRVPYKYTNSLKQYFSSTYLLLPLICGFVIAYAMTSRLYSQMMAESAIHRYSMIPLLYGVVIFALFTLGCVLWFFPYAKLISRANTIGIICTFVAQWMISLVLGVASTGFVAACFLVYVTVAVFLINQAALEKYFKAQGRTARNTRIYNIAISVVLLLCILFTTLFVLGLMAGAGSVLREAASIMLRESEEEEEEVKEGYIIVSHGGQGGAPIEGAGDFSPILRVVLYVDMAVLILGGGFVLIMNLRDPERLRSILYSVKSFFGELFELLLRIIGFRFRRDKAEGYLPQSYHEEHVDLSPSIRAARVKQGAVRSYSDFRSRLERLEGPEARYKYAYATMITLARPRYELKGSSTPRESAAHLTAQGWDEQINTQTEGYELTAYSPVPPPPERLEAELGEICARVRSML